MKKIICLAMALVFTMAFASVALGAQESVNATITKTEHWLSRILTNTFTTTNGITNNSSNNWSSTTTVTVTMLESDDEDVTPRIYITPVNSLGTTIGTRTLFRYTDNNYNNITHGISMSNVSPSTIKLKIDNNSGGVNLRTSGDWSNSYKE